MIQLVTNSFVVDKLKVNQEIKVRGALDLITLTVIEVNGKVAKLKSGSFTAFLRKESDGWYYDHTIREPRIRKPKIKSDEESSDK